MAQQLPHIEDVYSVFRWYEAKVADVRRYWSPWHVEYNKKMEELQRQFQARLSALGVYLDYTKREG